MALDYQRYVYRKKPTEVVGNQENSTSYGSMNTWRGKVFPEDRVITAHLAKDGLPVHLQYGNTTGYDDAHRSYLRLHNELGQRTGFPAIGPPRLRNGKGGSSWRHIKEVVQARGPRTVFVDGVPSLADLVRVRKNDIPGGNLVHPVSGSLAGRAHPLDPLDGASPRLSMRRLARKPRTAHDLQAFKATEKGNWMVMR